MASRTTLQELGKVVVVVVVEAKEMRGCDDGGVCEARSRNSAAGAATAGSGLKPK